MPEQPQPYVGPRWFNREDAPFFFGRPGESDELLSLVVAHSEVLLYAQSGAGKTSLINAKLVPLLEDEQLEVMPLARVHMPPSALPQSQIANIYVFNTLLSWAKGDVVPENLAKMTLRDFLEQRKRPLDREGLPKPCVAIFDQFEELVTSYPECWEQRRGFFEQVRDALDANPRLRALFAMREDYVAAIDRYAAIMPEKFRARFHLENLREPQALDAIKGPLTLAQPRRCFAKDVAEKLVKDFLKTPVETSGEHSESITGEFVEPIMLQVVCERLWRDLKPEETEITFKQLETASVETALLSFYEDSIQKVARQTQLPEPTLRSWFEKQMVTPAGTRGMVFRGETETEGLRNDAVDALDKLHLIRSERRGGSQWYELTHDRFIDSIRKSHEKLLRNLQAGAEETRQKLEKKAAEWADLGRGKDKLLAEHELLEAQHWLDSPEAAALGFSEKLNTLVEASRAEALARSARRRQRWTYALVIACFIALAAAGIAWDLRQKAIAAGHLATSESRRANQLRTVAEIETAKAKRLQNESKVDRTITLARNLAARSLTYKNSKLDLALLLSLEANRIADQIDPKTPQQATAKTSLLAEAKGGLLGGLVSNPHLRTFLQGHTAPVRSVVFSPNGKILASGGFDQKVILWDLAGYPLAPPLSGHKGTINSVAFSPADGMKVASCSNDGEVFLWDVENPKLSKSLAGGVGHLYSVAFSPNGKTLACGGEDGTVVLWEDVETGRPAGKRVGQNDKEAKDKAVYSVAFSPNGKTLAAGRADKKILFWDVANSKPKGSVEDSDVVLCIAFSPDGKKLASGNRGFQVTLWDVATRKRLGESVMGHANSVSSIAFSPNGATLVSASPDKTIRLWDVTSGKLKPIGEPIRGSSQQIYTVAFNKDGKTLASGGDGGDIVLWDIANDPLPAQRIPLGKWVNSVAFSSDGKALATGDFEGKITVRTADLEEELEAHHKTVTSVAFSPDGATLASASADGTIMLHSWDGKTWKSAPKSLGKDLKSVNSVAFSPNKTTLTLASAGDDGVIFWDVARGEPFGRPLKHGNTVHSIAFSPDGKTLASGADDWSIDLWDVANRESSGPPLEGHSYEVYALAFSPDGKILASGGGDTAVIFWDVAKRQALDPPFREHTGSVDSVAFSPDGSMLASSSSMDKSIILWDVATREPVGPLVTEDKNAVYAVAFGGDYQLAAATWGITYWDVDTRSLRWKADQVAARNLTQSEWKHFFGDQYRPTSFYGSLKAADRVALTGDLENARKSFKEVVQMALENGDSEFNNQVAWYGALNSFADIVLPACGRAIALAKDENKPFIRDTRGVALALIQKFPEAIKDFEAFVTWSKGEENRLLKMKTAEDEGVAANLKKMREKRETWITLLKSGRNPFDASTLIKLRREGAAFEGE